MLIYSIRWDGNEIKVYINTDNIALYWMDRLKVDFYIIK